MLIVNLLNLLFNSFHILAHDNLLVLSLWSPVRIHSCFTSLGLMVEYNYLNTCLYIV
jgi:hypothetical protein